MRRRTRLTIAMLSAAATAAAMLATALTLPSASATACEPLPDGASLAEGPPVMKAGPGSHQVTAPAARWAAVAVRGNQGDDPNLAVGQRGACLFRSSRVASPWATDWVALHVGAGRLPLGSYTAQVFNGTAGHPQLGNYMIEFDSGGSLLVTRFLSQPVGRSGDWLIDVRDVSLQAGVTYTFQVTGGQGMQVHLLSSTAISSTWAHSASGSTPRLTLPGDDPNLSVTRTFTVRPTATGRYGVLFARTIWVGPPTWVRVSSS
jgi:hypothetical protein